MNKQQLNPSNNLKNNNELNNQKPANRLVVIFVLMFVFGATLLVDSAFSSISHLFVVNENNENNIHDNGHFYSSIDMSNKNLRNSDVISNDDEFTLADTYLKKYYTEEQSRKLFRSDEHETQNSFNYQLGKNKNFRLVPHAFIENNDRTEIPLSPFGSKLTMYEECRNLCLKAGPKKCTYFSRSAFTPASSWNSNFEKNHKQSFHNLFRSRERLKKDRCARRKRSSLSVTKKKSLEERLKIIPKKCTFHFGFPNLVSSSSSPSTNQRTNNLQDVDEEAMMHEVWLPEELEPTSSSSSVSGKTKNVNDDDNSLIAFALQVSRPKMQGVQSALGALATYLCVEPNVAVFLDRSDAVHVGVIGHLLEETITMNSAQIKSIPNQHQRCIKISQMLELFDDLVDGFDVQTAAKDFINNTIHAKTETEEVAQWLSSFDSVSSNKKEDLKSRLQRQFRHFTSSSTSSIFTNKNTSLKTFRTLDDEYHDRHGVPLSVPFQRYIGSPSTTIAREARTPFLLDDIDDRQKCFQQIFEASHHSFDLSHPIPNFFSSSSSMTAQQVKRGSYDDHNEGGKLMIRFLNPVNHLFMSFGFPHSGSWMSLRALHDIALFFPSSKWYFLLEDETFILMKSLKYLLRFATISNQHRLSRNYYGFQMTVNPLPAHRHNFISSRSGILIPSVVMKELNMNMNAINNKQKQKSSSRISMCLAICRQNYIDERIACCMHGLDVGESHVNSFFPLRLGQSFPEVNFSHVTSFGNMKTFEDFILEEEQQEYHSKQEEREESDDDDVERKQKQAINEDDEGLEDARIAMEMNEKLKPVKKKKNNKVAVKKAGKVIDHSKSYFDDLVFAQDVLLKRKEIGEGCL